jgi:hypothetical protein
VEGDERLEPRLAVVDHMELFVPQLARELQRVHVGGPHGNDSTIRTGIEEPPMQSRLASYEEFWPFYVAQHRNPTNRALHFVGTSLVIACGVAGLLLSPVWFVAMPFAGYGFVWLGHFAFEKNKPATFTYPLWSLRGDFRMYFLMWRGRMDPEVRRAAELFPAGA